MLSPPRTVVRRDGGLYALERALQRRGFRHVAGADEAGRGACAGPLVAAAAILPEGKRGEIDGLADSKLLTPAARERVYAEVVDRALAWSVVIIPAAEVDARGLHVCNLAAMRRALASLTTRPEYVLTDGFPVDGIGAPGLAVWKGDQVAACVAAASVLAKVTRDRIMVDLDTPLPGLRIRASTRGTSPRTTAPRCGSTGPARSTGSRTSTWPPSPGAATGRRGPAGRSTSCGRAADALARAEGTVGVASGEQPRPPVPVGEDEAMEGEKR